MSKGFKRIQKDSKGMLAPLAIAICRRPAATKKTPNTKVPQPQAESTKERANAWCFAAGPTQTLCFFLLPMFLEICQFK
jgi:hypothetical protein